MTKYQPSNGFEMIDFDLKFCSRCNRDVKYGETLNGDYSCPILSKVFLYDVDDPNYPDEWICQNGEPICMSFEEIKIEN